MQELTPKQIVTELDRYIVGQPEAKRAVAVALRNRWRRQQLGDELKRDVLPKNILMMGPTGCGKTEIARRLASLVNAPFLKVEATKYTEVGYHGRDVESMVRDLLDVSIALVRTELHETVRAKAAERVDERLLDMLLPRPHGIDASADEQWSQSREKMRAPLRAGKLEESEVEISTEERANIHGLLGSAALELDVEMQNMFERMMPSNKNTRRVTIREARQILFQQEAEGMVDKERINRAAIERCEQSGIIFIDEIDKIAGADNAQGPDVSRQGVQRDLLPIVEGATVITKHGPVKSDHILFIAAGAFHLNKPSDLMPELQGRFPIRVSLKDLTKADFVRILTEPRNALTKQQVELLKTEGVKVSFTDDGIEGIAQTAYEINRRSQNIGARRLYTIMERVFESISFEAPDMAGQSIEIDAKYVKARLADAMKEEAKML